VNVLVFVSVFELSGTPKGHQSPVMSARVSLCYAVNEIKQDVIVQSTTGFTLSAFYETHKGFLWASAAVIWNQIWGAHGQKKLPKDYSFSLIFLYFTWHLTHPLSMILCVILFWLCCDSCSFHLFSRRFSQPTVTKRQTHAYTHTQLMQFTLPITEHTEHTVIHAPLHSFTQTYRTPWYTMCEKILTNWTCESQVSKGHWPYGGHMDVCDPELHVLPHEVSHKYYNDHL